MNELIPYLMQRLQQHNGTAGIAKPGTALERLILHGEVQPPVNETFSKPATRYGPIIDGEAVRSIPVGGGGLLDGIKGAVSRGVSTAGGSLAGMANPLMAAIMGSVQGDVLNNHKPRMYGPSGPAIPGGQVTGSPLPPVAGMGPPSPPISGPQSPTPAAPPTYPGVDAMAGHAGPTYPQVDPMAAHAAPMPQPRPQMAQAPMPMPQPRPPQAPQAPQEMGFFQRNTAMMRDPVTGMFIDPSAAARAQAQGGGLNNKAN